MTLKVREGVPSLRTVQLVRELERSFAASFERDDFRLCHYSIQGNHAHLIVEADDEGALGRGMKSIASRLARAVNRIFGRSGPVLADRYHLHVLRTPREVRNALAYVLLNARKHAAQASRTLSRALQSIRRPRYRRTTIVVCVIAASLALSFAGDASAGSKLPDVEFSEGAKLSPSCEAFLSEAAELLPTAVKCQVDSDCDHYPCSCSAIGTNVAGQRYKELVKSLQEQCGAGVVYAYCGSTKPVCENGKCSTRSVPRASGLDRLSSERPSKGLRSGTAASDSRFSPPDQEPRTWSFTTTTRDIPAAVRAAFLDLCRNCTFPEFGASLDGARSADTAARNLLEAGKSGTRWALRYEHAGACIHQHWIVLDFEREDVAFLGGDYSASNCDSVASEHRDCHDRSGRTCEW